MGLFRGLGARKDATRGTSPIEVRKALAGLFASTGVLPGGASPLLTGDATWAYNVGIANFVTSRGASDGDQLYGNDGVALIGATGVGSTVPIAPGAGLSRIDIAWTRHPTNGENGDTSSEPLFGVASGTAASSNPVAPTLPAGALELGQNLMTSAATSTLSAGNTITQSAPVAVLRANAAVDSGWVTATLNLGGTAGNWTATSGYPLQYRKIDNRVWVRGMATNAGVNTAVVTTLPVGFRPTNAAWMPVTLGSGSTLLAQPLVATTGTISIPSTSYYTGTGGLVFSFTTSFLTD